MSPYQFAIGAVINLSSSNYFIGSEASQGVRPVISIKPYTEITGTGTYSDPYVVVGSNTVSTP